MINCVQRLYIDKVRSLKLSIYLHKSKLILAYKTEHKNKLYFSDCTSPAHGEPVVANMFKCLMGLDAMLEDLPQACDVGTKMNSKGYKKSWIGYKLHIDAADGHIPI